MKIGFLASSGGHWEELLCITELAEGNEVFYITEEGSQSQNCGLQNIYILPQINRYEKKFHRNFIKLIFNAFKILGKEKPDVIITTGALIAVPFCWIAKLNGKKVIFIESFARVYNKSLSGKLVYPIADMFLVQWKPLLDQYPKAKYVGRIF